MLSKNKLKYFQQLHKKKFREENSSFFIEGNKMFEEAYKNKAQILSIVATQEWIDENSEYTNDTNIFVASKSDIQSISALKTAPEVWAEIKNIQEENVTISTQENFIVLDEVQDPGNLGTIIRTADWFGIQTIVCSETCADAYNPKVLQASMGSVFRTKILYTNLVMMLKNTNHTIYGAFLEGKNIFETSLHKPACIVLGNEGRGISSDVQKIIQHKIKIPGGLHGTESLNVSVAAGIFCAELFRK